ncbi:gas vesicle protein [Methylocystis sp. MJC1]|jgi:hypothetical protein|uniref:gas vesicle protein n=1 Tax=Methylocystis sp. MJC1 TaxID=2654282 RepID=UPI0013EBB1FA|nr:gas vesicle protein [Methylocystis sp. MJC1]KAF2990129.1 Gas vesicle structural protein [Methylocystis sp. MJC1]MBU6527616.1 gas vesicle protein [Methylocystis sp. MJC1]UZX10557.1 gas vesicle protein [Methylocystis sp. MJC1]
MSTLHQPITHSVDSSNLADLLERILDKGVVVAGDISIKLVEVELLTIQLRLVICSVDKARELGLDWWNHNNGRLGAADGEAKFGAIERRMERLEEALCALATAPGKPEGAHP